MIAQVFGNAVDEPMVNEPLGYFIQKRIPVTKTGSKANWRTNELEYLIPQTQEEHNALLNYYYPYRETMPNWKEMGQVKEREAEHYNSKDTALRKDLGAKSSVAKDIVYSPERNLAMIKLGNKYYTYSATPKQMQDFVSRGSLGTELGRIRRNVGTSLYKTTDRMMPRVRQVFW